MTLISCKNCRITAIHFSKLLLEVIWLSSQILLNIVCFFVNNFLFDSSKIWKHFETLNITVKERLWRPQEEIYGGHHHGTPPGMVTYPIIEPAAHPLQCNHCAPLKAMELLSASNEFIFFVHLNFCLPKAQTIIIFIFSLKLLSYITFFLYFF